MGEQDDDASVLLATELESLAVILVKDVGDLSDSSPGEVIAVLSEAIAIRKVLRAKQSEIDEASISLNDELSVSNNHTIVWMNDVHLLASIHDEHGDGDGDDDDDEEVCCEDLAIELLQQLESDVTLSQCEKQYYTAFMKPKLGVLFDQRNDVLKARTCFESAVAVQRQYLGSLHPILFQTLLEVGLGYLHAEQPERGGEPAGGQQCLSLAEQYITESTALRSQHVRGCVVTHWLLICLAEGLLAQVPLYMAKQELMTCKALIEKAYHMRCAVYGTHMHCSLAECFVEYGLLCKAMGKYSHAVLYLEESLKVSSLSSPDATHAVA